MLNTVDASQFQGMPDTGPPTVLPPLHTLLPLSMMQQLQQQQQQQSNLGQAPS